MSTILEVLRKAQEESRPKTDPGRMPGGLLDGAARRRRRRWIGSAVALVVSVGFAGGWWIGSRPRTEVAAPAAVAGDPAEGVAVLEPIEPPAAASAEPGAATNPDAAPQADAPPAAVSAPAAAPPAPPIAAPQVAAAPKPAPVEAPAPPPAIGDRQPPAYMEGGPFGEGPTRLRAIPRPGGGSAPAAVTAQRAPLRVGAPPVLAPAAQVPAPVAAAPAAGVAPAAPAPVRGGSFRDADEVRLAAEPPAAPPEPRRQAISGSRAATAPPAETDPGWADVADGEAEIAAAEAAADAEIAAAEAAAAGAPPAEARLASIPRAAPAPAPDADLLARAVRRSPTGAPDVTINIVQWSATPERRFAYVRVNGSQMLQVREGDEVGGLRVQRILREAVEFAHGGSSFILRAN